MKRILTMLFTTMLLAAALCVGASAADFNSVAEDLSAIGMFRGTANGFELDRAPTRSEAAIMLVRLYGAEDAAKTAYDAGEIKHPFTDVSAFTSPYVAWLYTNGITNGTSATTFGSANSCSTTNYVVFLLRALGYKDGTDFQYADALTFAQEKGFFDAAVFSGTFLRDDLAAVTYQALAADMADGKTYLLDSLIQSGAIDAKAAAPMTQKIEVYRAMEAATAGMDETAMDMDINMKMGMTMSYAGQSETMNYDVTGNMKVIAKDPTAIQLAANLNMTADGQTVKVGEWMKDGWMYVSMDDGTDQMAYKYQLGDQLAALEEIGSLPATSANVSGLALIDSITSAKSGSNTVYTVVIGKAMAGYMDELVSSIGEAAGAGIGMDLSDITMTITADAKGQLKAIGAAFDMAMKMPMEDGTSVNVAYTFDMDLNVKATGSSVKITYPDFSGYQEIDESQAPDLTGGIAA